MNKLIIGLLVCVSGFLGWQLFSEKKDQSLSQTPSTSRVSELPAAISESDASIENRLVKIEQLLTHFTDELAAVRKKQDENQAPLSDTSTDSGADEGVLEEAEEVNYQDRQVVLEETIQSTLDDDPAWSSAAVVNIEQTMLADPVLTKANNTMVECGGYLCRIETIVPGPMTDIESNEFQWTMLQSVGGQSLPNSTYQIENLSDGSKRMVFYLGREGYEMPKATDSG